MKCLFQDSATVAAMKAPDKQLCMFLGLWYPLIPVFYFALKPVFMTLEAKVLGFIQN